MATLALVAVGDAPPTWSGDVAAIVFERCAECHRPGQAAPFSLLTFDDFKKRGDLIAHVVESGQMPPWKALGGDFELRGDRRLSAAQKRTLLDWIKAGMPPGDPSKAPATPEFSSEWPLGPPDLVVEMATAYPVPADGPDIYRNFVIPVDLPEDRWVRAIDFRPGAPAVVHHSLFFSAPAKKARAIDAEDEEPGFGKGMRGIFRLRGDESPLERILAAGRRPAGAADAGPSPVGIGAMSGWALGRRARYLPEGMAYPFPAGGDLVLSTHFHPSGKAEQERSTCALYFAKEPPTKRFTVVQVPPAFGAFAGIDIPAGERDWAIEREFVLPVDAKAFMAVAHAHYLGKSMTMTATFPDGTTKTPLRIPEWDFAWQEQYEFAEWLELPKGTKLQVRITYDNSADNPRNPRNPPERVRFGEETFDEMGMMGLLMTAETEEDLATLRQAYRDYLRDSLLKAMKERPGDLLRLQDQLR